MVHGLLEPPKLSTTRHWRPSEPASKRPTWAGTRARPSSRARSSSGCGRCSEPERVRHLTGSDAAPSFRPTPCLFSPEHMFLATHRLRHWLHTADRAVDEFLAGDWAERPIDPPATASGYVPPAIVYPMAALGDQLPATPGRLGDRSAAALFGDVPTPLPPPATFAAVGGPPSPSRAYADAPEPRHQARRGHVRRTLPRRPGAVAPPPAACLSPVPARPSRRSR